MIDVATIADLIDPRAAQLAVAKIIATLGSQFDWSGDQLSAIAVILDDVTPDDEWPAWWHDQELDDVAYWQDVTF